MLSCTVSLGNLGKGKAIASVAGKCGTSVDLCKTDLLSDRYIFCHLTKAGLGRIASLQSTTVI